MKILNRFHNLNENKKSYIAITLIVFALVLANFVDHL